ncbi:MAG TPA: leucine--tRNA ligase [Bacteroidia bacterium]|nr:leucine--tRNA ligase [Bacteroidia bacterium]
MEYNFRDIEKKWQAAWRERKTYQVENTSPKPKYYVLDMFPYPSGAGLHVGHPLGYIASDIVARYKRLSGFHVLHPMGYDAFGLPAEQYAIQTGQHPAKTTEENINRYREQLDKMGFSFDWDREVRTSDPDYYKWTQWIFLQLFKSWYNHKAKKAEPIETLVKVFETEGFNGDEHEVLTGDIEQYVQQFTPAQWSAFSEKEKSNVLMNFRLAYLGEAWVNWCPALGTVLANDEVKEGVSERGGYPVERKQMPQWSMRITAYAERLLDDLNELDWPESIKETQRNWIGHSEGCSLKFRMEDSTIDIEVFTTRPDTIFGVSYMALAPEHDLVEIITKQDYKKTVAEYVKYAKARSERERMADVKNVTGQFTGAYVIHPFSGEKIPVWVGDYVLAGYGTGAVMAVPAHDSRDYTFAKQYNLPILEVITGGDVSKESYDAKEGKCINSQFLDGLEVKDAIKRAIAEIENRGLGKGKVNYRLRDAAFGRQRYWGEPIPIYYKDGVPTPLPEEELPLVLPEIDKFQPTETGDPPLGRAKDWKYKGQYDYELTTMPGWAGSSWYFLRYMDPHNEKEFVSKEAAEYWKNVDLYMGGAEHATGHLLYVRFWTKFLYDCFFIPVNEPAQKLINQGMIQGLSMIATVKVVHEGNEEKYLLVPPGEKVNGTFQKNYPVDAVKFLDGKYFIDEKGAAATREREAIFRNYFLSADRIELTPIVEKMSKSKYNVVTPDNICDDYGADTLRLYEMFLGPLEQHKPWSMNGITGVFGFLKRFWRMFFRIEKFFVSEEMPDEQELKILHRTIKKIKEDIERYSFNTCVSSFMIATNELMELKSSKRAVLEPLVIALSPFAPHIAEELWEKLGHKESVTTAAWPLVNEEYLVDDTFDYPVQVNGKVRFTYTASLHLKPAEIEERVLSTEEAKKWLDGKTPVKVIVVPKRIVNIVV